MPVKRLSISGRVQGVFFRASTQDKARELGVFGWVRNNPNGTVEVHAEGVGEAVDQLVEWCHSGPEMAEVDTVSVVESSAEGYDSFKVL